MKEKLLALVNNPDAIFWREFMRLMVSDAATDLFDKMRTIYASTNSIEDAKTEIRALAATL